MSRVGLATAALVGGRLGSGLATLITAPILVSRLGLSAFGVWTVLSGAAAVGQYADGGLGSMLLRETSRAHSSIEALRRARGALVLAFIAPTALCVALAAGVLAAWPAITSALHLGSMSAPARDAALLLVAALALDGWGSAGRAALEGTGHIPKVVAITSSTGALSALLGVLVVLDGHGLGGLGVAALVAAGLRTVALLALARRAVPDLGPSIAALRREDLRPLLRYGAAVQLTQASGAVNVETDRLVAGGVAGVATAGALDLGLRVGNVLSLIPSSLLYGLFPALSRLAARDDRRALDVLYVRTSRYVAVSALVPCAVVMACAPEIIVLWLGRPVSFAASSLMVLCPGIAMASLSGVATAICRAEGVPAREAWFAVTSALLNVMLTVVLAPMLGAIGIPLATSLATIVAVVGFLWKFHRATDRSSALLVDALAAPAAAAVAAGAAALLAVGWLAPDVTNRLTAGAHVVVAAAAGLAAASLVYGLITVARGRKAALAPCDGRDDDVAWVIYLSAIGWEGRRNRQHELAQQAGRGRRVLFVEPPGLGMSWRPRAEQLGPRLWRARPLSLLPFGRHLPWVNTINRSCSGWWLRRWLDGRPGGRVVILDEDLAAPLASRLGAHSTIYDAADLDWTFTRCWNRRHLRRALARAVDAADLVTVSSPVLAEHLPATGAPIVELLNACEAEHFETPVGVPPSIAALPRPRMGYVGAIDERALDAGLLEELARSEPQWTFVLAGPALPRVRDRLAVLPNVHLVGEVAYSQLPGVLQGIDVCLIPYRIGERIDYVQPKKLFEYLAAGKPVVSTALPALRGLDVPHRTARTVPDFARSIALSLESSCPQEIEARRRSAHTHSWEARGSVLRGLLDELEIGSASS
jgi:O-antigen/teichoic acid export membrane protein/glycosyltransferase involved in cell wall biosynthesis